MLADQGSDIDYAKQSPPIHLFLSTTPRKRKITESRAALMLLSNSRVEDGGDFRPITRGKVYLKLDPESLRVRHRDVGWSTNRKADDDFHASLQEI
jgi:hypothetical protein